MIEWLWCLDFLFCSIFLLPESRQLSFYFSLPLQIIPRLQVVPHSGSGQRHHVHFCFWHTLDRCVFNFNNFDRTRLESDPVLWRMRSGTRRCVEQSSEGHKRAGSVPAHRMSLAKETSAASPLSCGLVTWVPLSSRYEVAPDLSHSAQWFMQCTALQECSPQRASFCTAVENAEGLETTFGLALCLHSLPYWLQWSLVSLPNVAQKCAWGDFPSHSKGERTLSTLKSCDTSRHSNEVSLNSHRSGFQFYCFLENEIIATMGQLSAGGPSSSQEVSVRVFAVGYLWTDSSLGCILLHGLKYWLWQFCKPGQKCLSSREVLAENTLCARPDSSLYKLLSNAFMFLHWDVPE